MLWVVAISAHSPFTCSSPLSRKRSNRLAPLICPNTGSTGHGSARYDRSVVGSRLACTVALQEIKHALAQAPDARATDLEPWRQWLAHNLPAAVLKGWRRAVLQHGHDHPRADGTPPSTLPYGATLGVLVLTPHWWGYTGLGDWDLVRTNSAGPGELLSEEPFSPGGGEATCSLCMEGAEHHGGSRSGLVPIEADQEPFTLLLSTDGIRKSCGRDADFLTLARHLGALPHSGDPHYPSPLAEALEAGDGRTRTGACAFMPTPRLNSSLYFHKDARQIRRRKQPPKTKEIHGFG